MGCDSTRDYIDEQLELYVLDLLDDDEADLVERLLQDDPAARERVRELRGVASMMALELPPVSPSPDLKSRILIETRTGQAPATPIDIAERSDDDKQRRVPTLIPWAVAAVLAVALVASLLWAVSLQNQLDDRPRVDRYEVAGVDPSVGATGELVVLEGGDTAILNLVGLEQPEPGQVYQVWLIEGDLPQSAGTFLPDAEGIASVVVQGDLAASQVLAVTVEPTGGSPLPTTDPIIVGELSAAAGPSPRYAT